LVADGNVWRAAMTVVADFHCGAPWPPAGLTRAGQVFAMRILLFVQFNQWFACPNSRQSLPSPEKVDSCSLWRSGNSGGKGGAYNWRDLRRPPMKNTVIAVGVIAALIGEPAFAADMAVKAPPPALAPVYSWTGFYGGVNVGYGWANSSNNWNIFNTGTTFGLGTICTPAGTALCVGGNDSNHLDGALGGVQAGYNWQMANYVFGIETDIDITGQKGSQIFNTSTPGFTGFTTAAPVSASYAEKLLWFGTLRGRIGFTSNQLLFYGTGGLAYGEVKMNGSATISGANFPGQVGGPVCTVFLPAIGSCPLAAWSGNDTKVGFVLGGGIEGLLIDKWTWKIEYLFVDLGKVNASFATPSECFGGPGGCIAVGPGSGTISSLITDNIVRVGLNYQFR
jgi:outer membrane immunogenic protein